MTRGPVDARAAGGLDARPAGTLVPSDLAFGRRGALAARHEPAPASVDAYLKQSALAAKAPARLPAAPRPEQPEPKPAPALPPPPVVAFASKAEAATQIDTRSAQPLVAPNALNGGDMERYAQREQRARQLQGYRGGDVIIISAGTLIIILLVVILILLLT